MNEKPAQTVEEFSAAAVRRFLQTAVIVDDYLFKPPPAEGSPPGTVHGPTARETAVEVTAADNADQAEAPESGNAGKEPQWLRSDPNALVRSFAESGILCALLQPDLEKEFASQPSLTEVCRSADVVIVDWHLDDDGERATQLIGELVSQSAEKSSQQLRLIVVYTWHLDLQAIRDKVAKDLRRRVGNGAEHTVHEGDCHVAMAHCRVAVYSKSVERMSMLPGGEHNAASEEQLPEVVVKEFSQLANGLLQAVTLRCLAEIRDNSRRMLAKFDRQLDAGFATQLAHSLPDEDARQLLPLIASEMESVLEDALPDDLIPAAVMKDWCATAWGSDSDCGDGQGGAPRGDQASPATGSDTARDIPFAQDAVTEGFKEACKTSPMGKNAWNDFFRDPNDPHLDSRFAQLMASRTFYHDERYLQLGDILRVVPKEGASGNDDEYLVCLQPLCDSVRREGKGEGEGKGKGGVKFLFARAYHHDFENGVVANHVIWGEGKDRANRVGKAKKKEKSADHVLCGDGPGDSPLYLKFMLKADHSVARRFHADKEKKRVVAKSQEGEPGLCFVDVKGRRYRWLDRLRPAHAQRVAEDFSHNLARVGLTESQWLRNKKK